MSGLKWEAQQELDYQRLVHGVLFHALQSEFTRDCVEHARLVGSLVVGQVVDHRSDRTSDISRAHLCGGEIVACPWGATWGTGEGGSRFCPACRSGEAHVDWHLPGGGVGEIGASEIVPRDSEAARRRHDSGVTRLLRAVVCTYQDLGGAARRMGLVAEIRALGYGHELVHEPPSGFAASGGAR